MPPGADQLNPTQVSDISVLLLGDRGTGKTRLAARYAFHQFIDTRFQSRNTGAQKDVQLDNRNIHLAISEFPGGSCRAPRNLHLQGVLGDSPRGTNGIHRSERVKGRPRSDDITTAGIAGIPETNVTSRLNLGPDFIFASFQGEYRKSLIQRSDALMLVFNPSDLETFNWINDMVVKEIANCSQKKYLGKRVARLLDDLANTTANQGSRPRAKSALISTSLAGGPGGLNSASALTVVGSDYTRPEETTKRDSRSSKEIAILPLLSIKTSPIDFDKHARRKAEYGLEITPAPSPYRTQHPFLIGSSPNSKAMDVLEVDPDYPVLLVGACADRLEEYGGDEKREVSIKEATALAKKFGPGTEYIEVSALSDENVEAAFTRIMRQVVQVWDRRNPASVEKEKPKKLHKKEYSARSPDSHGFWKRFAYGFKSCFRSPQSDDIQSTLNSAGTSVASVKEAQVVTIRRFPSGASSKSARERNSRPTRIDKGPPPTHRTQGRSISQIPRLREIDPLPRLTLDDITVSDSRLGPTPPSPTRSLHDSVHETPSTSSDDDPSVLGARVQDPAANTILTNRDIRRSRKGRLSEIDKRINRIERIERIEREDKAIIRTGRVASHNVEISSTLAVTGRYTESTHGSIAGGVGSQTRNMTASIGIPVIVQIPRKRSMRQDKSDRALGAQTREVGYI